MSGVATLTQVKVTIADEELSDRAAATLEEVRVQQRLSEPSVCELRFFVPRDRIQDLESLAIGSDVDLQLPQTSDVLFRGEITAVEHVYGSKHGRSLRVRCYDRLHRLRKRQPIRAHVQVTPADLARELTSDLGFSVEQTDDGPVSPWMLQYRQSDLEFLVRTCRRSGLYLALREDVLHVLTLEGVGGNIALELGKEIFEARLELNAGPACRAVLAKGWNASRVEAHESRVEGARIGRDVPAEVAADHCGEGIVADGAFADDQHAHAVAQGELDARAAREVTLWGIAEGNPALQPGTRVDLSGVNEDFEGIYVLTSVEHRIDRRGGFVSEISTALPPTEDQPNGAVVVWGTVTSVEDPENLGRVRVWLPAIGKVETDWMSVMAAGAGSSKGLVILPDIDDQVLVLFIGGDPSQSVVLGGMYGANGPGDYGVDGSAVRRYSIGTSGGQKLKFDDAGQSIRLENKGGSFIDFSPDKFLLHSSVPLEIRAPGREVVISGKSIDFKQA